MSIYIYIFQKINPFRTRQSSCSTLDWVWLRTQSNPLPCPPQHSLWLCAGLYPRCSNSGSPIFYQLYAYEKKTVLPRSSIEVRPAVLSRPHDRLRRCRACLGHTARLAALYLTADYVTTTMETYYYGRQSVLIECRRRYSRSTHISALIFDFDLWP